MELKKAPLHLERRLRQLYGEVISISGFVLPYQRVHLLHFPPDKNNGEDDRSVACNRSGIQNAVDAKRQRNVASIDGLCAIGAEHYN